MNDYNEFQAQQNQHEKEAENKHETTGLVVHWLFLLIGAAISGGASYFIGHRGLAGNPFYERFIGAQNAAFLVVFLLDGTFLALCLGLASFLKSQQQRALARRALVAVKVILCLNLFAAFLMVQSAAAVPLISQYVTYGSPIIVGGVIWLWSTLFSHRRKNQMMANALDTQAQRDAMWARQYLADQARNRQAYDLIAASPAVNALRNEAARRRVIEDIAKQFALTYEEAEQIYLESEREREGRRVLPRSAMRSSFDEVPQHPIPPSRIQ